LQHFVGIQPGCRGEADRFAQALQDPGDAHLVGHFGGLAGPIWPDMNYPSAIGGHDRAGTLYRLGGSAAHNRELAILGPGLTAGNRCIDCRETIFGGIGGKVAGHLGGNCGVIDKQCALCYGGKCAVLALYHLLNVLIIADAGDDDVSAFGCECRSFRDLGRMAKFALRRLPAGSFGVRAVVSGDVMPSAEQVPCHRPAHYAKPDKGDLLLMIHEQGMRQESVQSNSIGRKSFRLFPGGNNSPNYHFMSKSPAQSPANAKFAAGSSCDVPSAVPCDAPIEVLSIDSIRAAAERIKGAVVHTPTMHSITLSEITGAEIWLKFENLQFTAAFKERGALNALLLMDPARRAHGVIAASAGNHSQGLSYHGRRLGVPVTIVMPRTTPTVKVMQTESVGGKVVLEGETFDEAYAHARKLEAELGLTFVHPFDDPDVAAGQGTLALEMFADAPDLDCIVTPIGGGGLISGMATVARAVKPNMKVYGVQAALFPSMYNKIKGEDMPCGGDTLAEGIAVKYPGEFTSRVIADRVDEILLVDEAGLEKAVSLLLQIEKTVVEGAGAAGLAAVLAHPEKFAGRKIGLVLCGGNIDTRLLANVLLRDLARSGRLARLRITLQDRPGSLYKVMSAFHDHNVNIIEIYHQRIFTNLPAKGLITDIECEARDRDQLDALVDSLRKTGYVVNPVELA
jgi:threonine dehydratase